MDFAELVDWVSSQGECEWIEYKENKFDKDMVGEYISALSNSALLHEQPRGFLAWGFADRTGAKVGTKVRFSEAKVGAEKLEHWLLQRMSPRIELKVHEGQVAGLY